MLLHGLFNVSDSFASYSETVFTHFIFDLSDLPMALPLYRHMLFCMAAHYKNKNMSHHIVHLNNHIPNHSKATVQPATDLSFEVSKPFFLALVRNVSNAYSVGAGSS